MHLDGEPLPGYEYHLRFFATTRAIHGAVVFTVNSDVTAPIGAIVRIWIPKICMPDVVLEDPEHQETKSILDRCETAIVSAATDALTHILAERAERVRATFNKSADDE